MDRFFQWVWDRHGRRFPWAIFVLVYVSGMSAYLAFSLIIVAFEYSHRYGMAVLVTAVALLVRAYIFVLPFSREMRLVQRWAAGDRTDPAAVLRATFTHARKAILRVVVTDAVWATLLGVWVGMIAGADEWRLVQYGIVGVTYGAAISFLGVHAFVEGAWRPVRAAVAGGTAIGDALPRSRPTIADWSNAAVLGIGFGFAIGGAFTASVVDRAREDPVVAVVIAAVITLVSGPLTIMTISPLLRPVRDLAEATERVAVGEYDRRLPVVQDDDLGALAASFNRMQSGLAERQRLQAAFGTYVDPALAQRLLDQADDFFTGERREVTVMFIDVRDFTPFAEAHPAEDVVARLNALFDILVPAVVGAGGHVNKFLGDGAMAVFGAPSDLPNHADAAVGAAVRIHRAVAARFGGDLRIGIGINTGKGVAGTIGGGGHLEFALIGDTTNVAARVEQLTKTTGDGILLTEPCVDALTARPAGLIDRGSHVLKGKSAPIRVFGLDWS